MSGELETGVVLRIHPGGFGFIAHPDVRDGVFFHARDLVSLAFDDRIVGQRVTYELVDGDRGPRASNVRPAD